jgi:hypothetical protein
MARTRPQSQPLLEMPIDANHVPAGSRWSRRGVRFGISSVATGPMPAPVSTQCPEVIAVAVQPKVIRPPVPAPRPPRRPTVDEQPPAPLGADANATAATPARSASGRGAMALVVVPLAGALAVLAAVVVVNATNDWWTLGPAMLIALVATACVLGTVVRMLADND